MSKSLARVKAALLSAGLSADVLETGAETRTAAQAAAAAACMLDQIVKSILFRGETTGKLRLFLTAGGNQVCPVKASTLAGELLGRADAAQVRTDTGFAIGGVAPIGHLTPLPTYFDPRLLDFPQVWAAAGTPRHIFPIPPQTLLTLTKAHLTSFTA